MEVMVHKSTQPFCGASRCSSPRGHLAQQAVWLRVCLCVCVCVCQDANEGMTDVPCEGSPGTSPPLLFVLSGSTFIELRRCSSGQTSDLYIHPPACLSVCSRFCSFIDFLNQLVLFLSQHALCGRQAVRGFSLFFIKPH